MTDLKRASVFLQVNSLSLGYGETFENSDFFQYYVFKVMKDYFMHTFFFFNKKSYIVDP